jgi:hypothetical protein
MAFTILQLYRHSITDTPDADDPLLTEPFITFTEIRRS